MPGHLPIEIDRPENTPPEAPADRRSCPGRPPSGTPAPTTARATPQRGRRSRRRPRAVRRPTPDAIPNGQPPGRSPKEAAASVNLRQQRQAKQHPPKGPALAAVADRSRSFRPTATPRSRTGRASCRAWRSGHARRPSAWRPSPAPPRSPRPFPPDDSSKTPPVPPRPRTPTPARPSTSGPRTYPRHRASSRKGRTPTTKAPAAASPAEDAARYPRTPDRRRPSETDSSAPPSRAATPGHTEYRRGNPEAHPR